MRGGSRHARGPARRPGWHPRRASPRPGRLASPPPGRRRHPRPAATGRRPCRCPLAATGLGARDLGSSVLGPATRRAPIGERLTPASDDTPTRRMHGPGRIEPASRRGQVTAFDVEPDGEFTATWFRQPSEDTEGIPTDAEFNDHLEPLVPVDDDAGVRDVKRDLDSEFSDRLPEFGVLDIRERGQDRGRGHSHGCVRQVQHVGLDLHRKQRDGEPASVCRHGLRLQDVLGTPLPAHPRCRQANAPYNLFIRCRVFILTRLKKGRLDARYLNELRRALL